MLIFFTQSLVVLHFVKMGDEVARRGGRYCLGVLRIYCVDIATHVAGSGAWPVYAPAAFQTNHLRPLWAQELCQLHFVAHGLYTRQRHFRLTTCTRYGRKSYTNCISWRMACIRASGIPVV